MMSDGENFTSPQAPAQIPSDSQMGRRSELSPEIRNVINYQQEEYDVEAIINQILQNEVE